MTVAFLAAAAMAPAVAGHSPDPQFSGPLFGQDQLVEYRWRSGQVPPAWMKTAINEGAEDSNASRQSRAAVFGYDATSGSMFAYGEPDQCGVLAAACANRSGAPDTFAIWIRPQGYQYDWGMLRWCQAYANWPDGCHDAEAVALHELGHVQILNHHVLLADQSDYRESVMNALARSKPVAGYNAHKYARCDLAILQRRYDIPTSTTPIALCQSLDTTLALSATGTSIVTRQSVTFTATLRLASNATNGRLSANPLSQRSVTLQRRLPGAATWSGMGSMEPSTGGTYVMTQWPTVTYEWRAVFPEPVDEGLQTAASGILTVTVTPCTTGGCPNADGR